MADPDNPWGAPENDPGREVVRLLTIFIEKARKQPNLKRAIAAMRLAIRALDFLTGRGR